MRAPSQSSSSNLSRLLRRAARARDDNDLAAAERLYTAVLAHRPDSFDALHGLGQINYRRGRLDAALALMQQALKNDLSRADGFAGLGSGFHRARAVAAGAGQL